MSGIRKNSLVRQETKWTSFALSSQDTISQDFVPQTLTRPRFAPSNVILYYFMSVQLIFGTVSGLLLRRLGLLWWVLDCISFILMTVFWTGLTFSDPGYVLTSIGQSQKRCYLCQLEVSKKTRHCFRCNSCVQGYDHHCGVLDKCVGKKNMRWFKGSLITVAVQSISKFFILIFLIFND